MRFSRLLPLVVLGTVACSTGVTQREVRTSQREIDCPKGTAGSCFLLAPAAPSPVDNRMIAGERRLQGDPSEREVSWGEEALQSTHIGAAPAVRRHTKLIDVHLNKAPLDDALRFVGRAGGFNIIVGDALAAPVTVELNHVDAFDALAALAEVHGLVIEDEHGILLVHAARATSSAKAPEPMSVPAVGEQMAPPVADPSMVF